MADDVETFGLLQHLGHMRRSRSNIEADMSDVKLRLSAVERHLGQTQIQMAGLNSRMDRFDERLGLIECRLERVEA